MLLSYQSGNRHAYAGACEREKQMDQQSYRAMGGLLRLSVLGRIALLLALVSAGLLLPSAPAFAQPPAFASYWKLSFDFADSFNGNLLVEMGYDDGNGAVEQPALVTRTTKVVCQRVGAVLLSSGAAVFNGGYLQCTLDVQAAIEDAAAACQQVDGNCEIHLDEQQIYQNFQMAAKVYTATAGVAPLFDHPDAYYAIHAAGAAIQLEATLTNMGTKIATPVVATLPSWQSYRAHYQCNGCTLQVDISGVSENIAVGPDRQISFYTPRTTIYLGYNGDTGAVIPAGTVLDYLAIDPPNYGNN